MRSRAAGVGVRRTLGAGMASGDMLCVGAGGAEGPRCCGTEVPGAWACGAPAGEGKFWSCARGVVGGGGPSRKRAMGPVSTDGCERYMAS